MIPRPSDEGDRRRGDRPGAGVRDGWIRPHPSRLDPQGQGADLVLAAHDAAVAAGETGYTDPLAGWWVFTAVALRDRGSCCDQGCRHCPWVGAEEAGPPP